MIFNQKKNNLEAFQIYKYKDFLTIIIILKKLL